MPIFPLSSLLFGFPSRYTSTTTLIYLAFTDFSDLSLKLGQVPLLCYPMVLCTSSIMVLSLEPHWLLVYILSLPVGCKLDKIRNQNVTPHYSPLNICIPVHNTVSSRVWLQKNICLIINNHWAILSGLLRRQDLWCPQPEHRSDCSSASTKCHWVT